METCQFSKPQEFQAVGIIRQDNVHYFCDAEGVLLLIDFMPHKVAQGFITLSYFTNCLSQL